MAELNALRARAVELLLARVGQREWGGQNQGLIVKWATRRFLSEERFQEAYVAGKLAWCAGSIGAAYLDALAELGTGDEGFLKRAWSLDCDTLWARHLTLGWAWQWNPGGENARQPQPGDVIFLITMENDKPRYHHTGEPDLRHVRLVVAVDGDHMEYVAGNEGNEVVRASMRLDAPALFGFSRVGGP